MTEEEKKELLAKLTPEGRADVLTIWLLTLILACSGGIVAEDSEEVIHQAATDFVAALPEASFDDLTLFNKFMGNPVSKAASIEPPAGGGTVRLLVSWG